MNRIYIDGAAGTVGLALQERLPVAMQGCDYELITLADADRKQMPKRYAAMAGADVVVLCLPDAEASAAARLACKANPQVRILDASAAHRCAPTWVYGLPEVTPADVIQAASMVANPGCFATACILAAKPVAELLREQRADTSAYPRMAFQGVTGYSAGGRKLVDNHEHLPVLSQFGKAHRHLPEIEVFGRVTPSLTTMTGPWYAGMLIQTQVDLPVEDVLAAYHETYATYDDVQVLTAAETDYRISPEQCNGTNLARIVIAAQPNGSTAIAVVIDNLGKGSAGAAASNLRLMLS